MDKQEQTDQDRFRGGGGEEGGGRMGASCVVCQVMLSLSFARLASYHRAARPVSWLQMAMCWPRQPSIKSQDGSSGLRPTGSSGSTHPQCNKRTFEKIKPSSGQRRSPLCRRESPHFSLDASVPRCLRQHVETSGLDGVHWSALVLALIGRDWVAQEFWQEVTDCPRKQCLIWYTCAVCKEWVGDILISVPGLCPSIDYGLSACPFRQQRSEGGVWVEFYTFKLLKCPKWILP